MSWIFATIGRSDEPEDVARLDRMLPASPVQIRRPGLFVAAAGPSLTCRWGGGTSADPDDGWVVVGMGLRQRDNHVEVLSESDWQRIVSVENASRYDIDGHFAGLRWSSGKLVCFTDSLGLRALYVARRGDITAISTRLDWLARWSGRSDVNMVHFGSHWLTFNQIGYRSLVNGIERLGPGTEAVCTQDNIKISSTPWSPVGTGKSVGSFQSTLSGFLAPRGVERPLSLGLSGGMDSRLLLALLNNGSRPFFAHVFGDPSDPDVRVSLDIARDLVLSHRHIRGPISSKDELPGLLRQYAGQVCATVPASTILRALGFEELNREGKLVVDGGFGEIGRRQYYNRLLNRGAGVIRGKDVRRLYTCLSVNRGNFFTEEVGELMRRGVDEDLANLFDSMPDAGDLDRGNWADLMAVRHRLPNFFGYEQARMDGIVPNYMPFAQPSFLHEVFQIPLRQRANGRLFRRTIRQTAPHLRSYPLVKGGTTYPFGLGAVSSKLWTQARVALEGRFADPTPLTFFFLVAEYLRNLVHDHETTSCGLYDMKRVSEAVDAFYRGDTAQMAPLDWWLSFEVWRRSLRER